MTTTVFFFPNIDAPRAQTLNTDNYKQLSSGDAITTPGWIRAYSTDGTGTLTVNNGDGNAIPLSTSPEVFGVNIGATVTFT